MKKHTTKTAVVLLAALIVMMAAVIIPVDQACAEPMRIIRESAVSSDYQPGAGTPIGKVSSVYGKVFIMHADMGAIYIAEENLALYAGDTITTKQDGKIAFVMKDDSVMTLAPNTTMVLNEAVFDPASKTRSSLVNLIAGKARFFVKKFSDFQYSTFRVKTKTSIAAVRGSEFIIEITEEGVRITTGGNTVLYVTDLVNDLPPGTPPIMVTSFQQLVVKIGELTRRPINITEEALTDLLGDLIDGDGGQGEGGGGEGGQQGDGYGGNQYGHQFGGGSYNDTPVSPSSPE